MNSYGFDSFITSNLITHLFVMSCFGAALNTSRYKRELQRLHCVFMFFTAREFYFIAMKFPLHLVNIMSRSDLVACVRQSVSRGCSTWVRVYV